MSIPTSPQASIRQYAPSSPRRRYHPVHPGKTPPIAVILLGDFNMRPSRGPEDKEANKDNPKVTGFDRIVSTRHA